jgi:hypothetical protein
MGFTVSVILKVRSNSYLKYDTARRTLPRRFLCVRVSSRCSPFFLPLLVSLVCVGILSSLKLVGASLAVLYSPFILSTLLASLYPHVFVVLIIQRIECLNLFFDIAV